MPHSNHHADVIIIGCGLVGMTMALTLSKQGLTSIITDKYPKPAPTIENDTDGRSYAIALGSVKTLQEAGLWDAIQDQVSPILDIRVSDQHSSMKLHYHHKDVGDAPMGYMVGTNFLNYHALNAIHKDANITINAPATIESLDVEQGHITFDNHETQSAPLIIVADGKHSATRELIGIKTLTHHYHQSGIVCTIAHEKHHHDTAQERFLAPGPFAILPLKGGYHSSLVWTEHERLAPIFCSMDQKECEDHIFARTTGYLGKINIASKRYHYPLTLKHAQTYTKGRCVLIGDAAHGIHPLAGQGFNLGLRDIQALAPYITNQHLVGLDIGCKSILEQYNQCRKYDSWSLIGITHGLNQLFTSSHPTATKARRIGANILNNLPFIKKRLIKHAMGITG